MPEPATDHRRAISERNLEAILDAAERLLEQHKQPSIVAVAAESDVSRVTVYAHFATREALLEALVERALGRAITGLDAARPDEGPAPDALERVIAASAHELGRHVAIAAAATAHLDPGILRRAHELSLAPVRRLIERGRGDGSFRADLPAEWQVTCFYTLLHAAGEDIREGRAPPAEALDALTRSLCALIVAG